MSNLPSSAGKILLMPKGVYNPATTYYPLNVVYYETNNSKGLYVAKQITTNVVPTDTTNWQIFIDLTDFISVDDIATAADLGLIKSDGGQTTEIDIYGVLKAIGVGIVCTVNTGSGVVPYGPNWLKWNNTVITPDTRQMYRVNVDGKEYLFFWDGTQYIQLSGGGHNILNSNGTAMDQRQGLQFRGMNVSDDSTNDKTIIDGQVKVCTTETEWNQKSQAETDDANTYWFLPWKTETSGEIKDSTTAPDKVWSSQKVNSENTALKAMVTDDYVFSPTKAYVAGDWLIHNNILYEVLVACTGVTPPDATYYNPITLHELKNRIDALEDITDNENGALTVLSPYITAGSRNNVYRKGQWMYISAVLSVTSDIAQSSSLFKLPFNSIANIYFYAATDAKTVIPLTVLSDKTVKNELYSIPNGTVFRIGCAIPFIP